MKKKIVCDNVYNIRKLMSYYFFFFFYHDAGHKVWALKNCVIPTTLTSMLDIFLHSWYIYIFSIDNKYTSAYLSNL